MERLTANCVFACIPAGHFYSFFFNSILQVRLPCRGRYLQGKNYSCKLTHSATRVYCQLSNIRCAELLCYLRYYNLPRGGRLTGTEICTVVPREFVSVPSPATAKIPIESDIHKWYRKMIIIYKFAYYICVTHALISQALSLFLCVCVHAHK